MNFSPFAALKTAISADFLFSLKNSRYQESPPIAALILLTTVFCTIASLMFLRSANAVVAGVVVSAATFWASFVFSAFVLLFFGPGAPVRHIEKAISVFLCSFLFSVMALSVNIFRGYDVVIWVGQEQPFEWAALYYALPYPLLCLYLSYRNLEMRTGKLRNEFPQPGHQMRIRKHYRRLGISAFAAFVCVTLLTQLTLWLNVIEPNKALQKISEAISSYLPSWG